MLPVALLEFYYYLSDKPYFSVIVLSNGRKVKRFIQLAAGIEKGEDFFLISKSLKASWWKPETPIIDGKKFLTFVDLNNAIPLKIESKVVYTDSEYFIREKTILTISEDVEKQKKNKKDGKPLNLTEITFPPSLLFQKVEAHFVKEIQAVPPSKWEELKWVFIAGFVVLGFLGWQVISSGALNRIG